MILKQTITAGAGTAEGQPCPMMWCETGRCTYLLTTYSDQHSGPAFYPLCEDCANRLRRAELDRELQEIGAVVIQVEDLGAVAAVLDLHWPHTLAMPLHLARLALGEVRS